MVKYRIEVDRDGCIACGVCYTLDPSHFESDEDGKSMVVGGETDESRSSGTFEDDEMEMAQEGEGSCPVFVITVTEL